MNQSLLRERTLWEEIQAKGHPRRQRTEISLRIYSSIYEVMIGIALEGNGDSFL